MAAISPISRRFKKPPVLLRQQSESALKIPGSKPLLDETGDVSAKNTRRLVVLGSSNVGKTAIVKRFLQGEYEDKYQPTIEDFHRKVYRIKGEAYRLDILDTSGNNPFPAMRRLSLVTGDIFLLVYGIDNQESFDEVKRIQEQIYEIKGSKAGSRKRVSVPVVIVGNKCELEYERVVGADELRELAVDSAVEGFEASAKDNFNIDEIFIKLFYLAKLPSSMSPSHQRKAFPGNNGHSPGSQRRGLPFRKKGNDTLGTVTPHVRRPSIRTDLLKMQTKYHSVDCGEDVSKDGKCVLQ